jgi:hypothetical protein
MKKRTTIWLDITLLKEFHKRCIEEGTSMAAVINELIKEWLKK